MLHFSGRYISLVDTIVLHRSDEGEEYSEIIFCLMFQSSVFFIQSINQHIYLNIIATVAGFKKQTHVSSTLKYLKTMRM